MSAQTACSRDDPVPKSGPATNTDPLSNGDRLRMKDGSVRHAANNPSSNPVRVTRFKKTAGMIWSVSTFDRRSGTPIPVWVWKASIAVLLIQVGRSGQRATHGGRGGHGRRRQMRAAALALAALEVAVRSRRTALAG